MALTCGRPLGIAMFGTAPSQILTSYTTHVIYIFSTVWRRALLLDARVGQHKNGGAAVKIVPAIKRPVANDAPHRGWSCGRRWHSLFPRGFNHHGRPIRDPVPAALPAQAHKLWPLPVATTLGEAVIVYRRHSGPCVQRTAGGQSIKWTLI